MCHCDAHACQNKTRAGLVGADGAYRVILHTVLAGRYTPAELDALCAWREVNGVTDEQHTRVGAAVGTAPVLLRRAVHVAALRSQLELAHTSVHWRAMAPLLRRFWPVWA